MNHARKRTQKEEVRDMNYAEDRVKPTALYSFGLPDVEPGVKLTCVFCGGPAISEIELFDEVICDLCYTREAKFREEADNQYCYDKGCGIQTDPDRERDQGLGCCDGKCARCML
jgi:hypothetical protein